MQETLASTATRVQYGLDDMPEEIWSRSDIESWIKDGYDRLVRATNAIFDMVMFSTEPVPANHTRKWEEQFMTGSSFPILGIFTFTRESEREFAGPGAIGPFNYTRPSEVASIAHPAARLTGTLPEGYTSIDRVTHDWLRLEPEMPRYLREQQLLYKTVQGGVFEYTVHEDGLFELRTSGVPIPRTPTIETSGSFGMLRQEDSTEDDDDIVIGSWGILRAAPQHFPMGGAWGIMRRIIKDDLNTRVELYRLGKSLDQVPFEVPARFVKYVEFWAMSRAYSINGPGEDKVLAQHFAERFQIGVDRLKNRVNEQMAERTYRMGGKIGGRAADDYLRHFPTDYNYPRPFRP